MNKLHIMAFAALALSSAVSAQVFSTNRTFPPAGSSWVSTTPLATTDGTNFASMEITDFVGAHPVPTGGSGGILPPIVAALKTRTKSNSCNERIGFTLTPRTITSTQEIYDGTVELIPDLGGSNPVQFKIKNNGNHITNVTLTKQSAGGYIVSGGMSLDLEYTENSGATWASLTTTANFTLQPASVPEPGALICIGLAGVTFVRRKKK